MMSKFVLNIEQSPVLHTKWGTAKLQKSGYYIITSRKEGNNCKRLHRLIYEDHYGPLNDDEVCHHLNGCKNDNCICNLQGMKKSKHSSDHNKEDNHPMYGKHHSIETRVRMSEAKSGENHPLFGKKRPEHSVRMSGENNPRWKDYARVVKHGVKNNKQMYGLKHNGKIIKWSINKNKLDELANKINMEE